MSHIENLEKLAELKKKGVLSQAEFDAQKKALLSSSQTEKVGKSRAVYVLLAFFLGGLGIHNFYAGYKGRAIAQLLLTLLSPVTLFISVLAVQIWIIVEMFIIKKDAKGVFFRPATALAITLGVISSFGALMLLGLVSLGGLFGLGMAVSRYEANEALDYAAKVSIMAMTRDDVMAGMPCEVLLPMPEDAEYSCAVATADGNLILLQDLDELVYDDILELAGSHLIEHEQGAVLLRF